MKIENIKKMYQSMKEKGKEKGKETEKVVREVIEEIRDNEEIQEATKDFIDYLILIAVKEGMSPNAVLVIQGLFLKEFGQHTEISVEVCEKKED